MDNNQQPKPSSMASKMNLLASVDKNDTLKNSAPVSSAKKLARVNDPKSGPPYTWSDSIMEEFNHLLD